jgi:type IV pilus assembly protein PilF
MRTALPLLIAALLLGCAGLNAQKQATVHYKLGVSRMQARQYQAAFLEFQKALRYDPRNKEVHNALGVVYLQFDDLGKARASFQKAVEIDGNYSEALNNLCYVHYRLGQYEQAIGHCKRALGNPLYPTPEKAFYNLARAYYRLGRYDEALKAYREALRRMPGMFQALYGLALTYNAKGLYGAAAQALKEAVELDPRYRGDMAAAEEDFSLRRNLPVEEQDMEALLEVFRY